MEQGVKEVNAQDSADVWCGVGLSDCLCFKVPRKKSSGQMSVNSHLFHQATNLKHSETAPVNSSVRS